MAVREAIPSKSDGVVNRRVKKSNKTARNGLVTLWGKQVFCWVICGELFKLDLKPVPPERKKPKTFTP